MDAPVVILGAGPAGLSAAWELSQLGRRVVVLEKGQHVGGLCATVERDGYRFDLGGHRLISKNSALVERIQKLMGPELVLQERRSLILLDGRRYRYPLELRDVLRTLPAGMAARAVMDLARSAVDGPQDAPDFEGWVRTRFGVTLYDAFFGPYTQKLWGMPPSRLSSDWASQRISLLNLQDVGLRLMGLRHGKARTYARRYLYPRLGMGMLFDKLAQHLGDAGVTILPGTWARHLHVNQGRVERVHWEDRRGASGQLDACQVISTMPLQDLARMLQPQDQAVARAAASLRHRGMRFLNMQLTGGPVLDATWAYVASPRYRTTRIQDPAARSTSMVPQGCASLMLEVPCNPGEPLWEATDAELLRTALAELAELGFPVGERCVGAFSSRAADAYPVYSLDYRSHVSTLLHTVQQLENLHTCGRQGLFRYVFMDTAMEMGMACAARAHAGLKFSLEAVAGVDRDTALLEAQALTA